MKWENKFLVMKWEWVDENLDKKEIGELFKLLEKAAKNKPSYSYYVVNTDEPYADEVWKLIEEGKVKETVDRINIQVQYPVLDHTESVANIGINEAEVKPNGKVKIENAFFNRNNSLFITINNPGDSSSVLTIKAGDAYPNSMLGDVEIEIPKGVSAINLQDLARFERADGSMDLDFDNTFSGTIYAVAKWAGVR